MLSEHSILRALRLYYMSAFKDFLKIVLGGYSAFVRISGHNNGGLHLRPVCLDMGKGHLRTLYACRSLYSIDASHNTKELLHQAKVAIRPWPSWPQTIHYGPHGKSG